MTVHIQIPDEVLSALPWPAEELASRLRVELAVALYAADLLSFAEARGLAGQTRLEFVLELGLREVPRHYTEADLEEDLAFVSRQQHLATAQPGDH